MMRTRTRLGTLWLGLAATGVLLAATSAAAFDLTGVWQGKISCSGILEGHPRKVSKSPSTMFINESDGLRISVDGIGYNGKEIPSLTKPTRGEVALIRCGSSPTLSGGEFSGEFGRMKVATKPDKGTGAFRGLSLRTDVVLASSVYTCRWSYKRVSTSAPTLESCP